MNLQLDAGMDILGRKWSDAVCMLLSSVVIGLNHLDPAFVLLNFRAASGDENRRDLKPHLGTEVWVLMGGPCYER